MNVIFFYSSLRNKQLWMSRLVIITDVTYKVNMMLIEPFLQFFFSFQKAAEMAAPSDFSLCETKRADDKKALDLARVLVEEARGLATTLIPNVPMLNDKVAEIFGALNIAPPGSCSSYSSCKQEEGVTPDSMLKELDVMIDQSSEVIESGEPDHPDTDVVFKASGGRALCGVYYSNYKPVKTAGRPILSAKPENVSIFHPDQTVEESYKHFIMHGAAAEFVKSVARNGTHIGVEVKGLANPYGGRIGGGGVIDSTSNTEETRTAESLTTSVSVMHCKSIAMKEFQIKDGKMELPQWVKNEALFIKEKGDNDDGRAAARDFMKWYGSHVPAGKHKLGGIFYTIADVQSDQSIETSTLSKIAKRELESHISSGFLDSNIKHTHKSDMSELITTKEASIDYTFSKIVIGPRASNPKQFENLLSYNWTWAIIDRGPVESYIPVWRLIRRCGAKYELAADILEKAWKGDEEKRKKKREQQELMQQVEQELIKTKEEHLKCRVRTFKHIEYRVIEILRLNQHFSANSGGIMK